MMGLLNGDRLNRRLVRCDNGFFIHVLFFASPSLWSELYQSDPLLADTLHTVEVYPVSERTRRSIVFIAEGYSLILSRRYHRAAKFTKNKNDQWNHAGGFSISICAGLSLKMQPRNN